MNALRPRLLWIDGIGGLVVGALFVGLAPWLAELYGFSAGLTRGLGVANLAYGSFSLPLARRAVRPMWRIKALALANVAWGVVCAVLVVRLWGEATAFGTAHLALEGTYVAELGALEWRWREALRVR